MSRRSGPAATLQPPGAPAAWRGPLEELERWEWRAGEHDADPRPGLAAFLAAHGLAAPPAAQHGGTAVVLLAGAVGCARLAGLPAGRPSPVPAVPEIAAVAVRRSGPGVRQSDVRQSDVRQPDVRQPDVRPPGVRPPGVAATSTGHPGHAGRSGGPTAPDRSPRVGPWRTSWTDAEHAAAVQAVRERIAVGAVYQANVVGHRHAGHRVRPAELAAAVAGLPGADYAGVVSGPGWAVGSASPEQLVRVDGRRITTVPVKGTAPVAPGSERRLRASLKDRAEHVMIVDLERNDLSRVAATGTVEVEELYTLTEWAGLWHAGSRVAATLREDAGTLEVLAALLPGGSVTGAPKRAACALLAELEPVGRGPAMGAFGLLWPGGMDLGLTIRTVGVDEDSVHLWAGGGITWDSDPAEEVAEAHAKAAPVLAALA